MVQVTHCSVPPSTACIPWLLAPPPSYGYATNTRVKFIIVIENTSSQSRDGDMKVVSQQIPLHDIDFAMYCM